MKMMNKKNEMFNHNNNGCNNWMCYINLFSTNK